MKSTIVRLVTSPPLSPHILEAVVGAAERVGRVLAAVNDQDLHASVLSIAVADGVWGDAADAISSSLSANLFAGRAFRFEVMSDEPGSLTDEAIRSVAVRVHGLFAAPVYIARRDVPAAAWALTRPMPWGRKGLAVGQTAPSLPFGGSDCLGVAIEIGMPTAIAKVRLENVPEHGLLRACAAVGGAESGFADVGVYPAVSVADGTSIVALEFSNLKRSPFHRAFAVLDIEAQRFGGRLGSSALLSHVPLDALLDVLNAHSGLDAALAQVLETHLSADRAT